MGIRGRLSWFLLGLVFIALFGCVREQAKPQPDIRNVLLVSIDTCRADRLSCYGYHRQTTPHIDQLARDGVLFRHVVTPAPITLPAHCSMLTGTVPPFHGVKDNEEFQLSPVNVTLAEILKEHGFATGAVIGAFVLNGQFGLNQGFDTYHDRFDQSLDSYGFDQRRAEEVTRHAFKWLEEHHQENFFLFLHYFDPHAEFDPPEPFMSRFSNDPYAGEIAYTDHCIGLVMDKLKALKIDDSTLVIITSDHGEMLGEHGELSHSYFVYESSIRVPLIFRLPAKSGGERIDDPVGLIDIVPTVCGLLGINPPGDVQGLDLSGYLEKKKPRPGRRHLYFQSFTPTKYDANFLAGIVQGQWKYIYTTRPELYDLVKDPRETNNLYHQHSRIARSMENTLIRMLEQQYRPVPDRKRVMSNEDRKRLVGLGYVSGSIKDEYVLDPNRSDPKDRITFHVTYSDLEILIHRKRYKEAEAACENLIEQFPGFVRGYLRLGKIAAYQQDAPKAIKHFLRALELDPNSSTAHNNIGAAYAFQGKLDQAITHFRKAIRIQPLNHHAKKNLERAMGMPGATKGK